ncbi:MAG: Gfo/Idh/MocA family oxidoreductase [Candidatus Margulisiibacteriota bacterium]
MKKGRGLKFGVIGVGTMGQHHARVISALPGAKLFGIADLDQEKAKQVGVRFGAEVFQNYQELFPQVDAIILASPTETHFEIAKDCLEAGKNILIEKPICQNLDDAKTLIDLIKSKNLVCAIGLIERFNPAFQELQKLIRKEKIIGIQVNRFSPFPERITDANVIQDMMVHDLDLLLSLIPNEEIETLKAHGEKVKSEKLDKVSATVFYKSGLIAKVDADRVFGIKTRKITVTTERALIEADLLNKRVYVRDLQHHLPSIHHTKNYDQLTAELSDFVKAIKTGTQPRVTAEDGYKVLALSEEVEKACF